jgi:hypothetical protein
VAHYFDLEQVDYLIDRNRAGIEDCTDRIWRLLTFQLWCQIFINRNRDLLE